MVPVARTTKKRAKKVCERVGRRKEAREQVRQGDRTILSYLKTVGYLTKGRNKPEGKETTD